MMSCLWNNAGTASTKRKKEGGAGQGAQPNKGAKKEHLDAPFQHLTASAIMGANFYPSITTEASNLGWEIVTDPRCLSRGQEIKVLAMINGCSMDQLVMKPTRGEAILDLWCKM